MMLRRHRLGKASQAVWGRRAKGHEVRLKRS
jgi:hypothetical protein